MVHHDGCFFFGGSATSGITTGELGGGGGRSPITLRTKDSVCFETSFEEWALEYIAIGQVVALAMEKEFMV